MKEISSRDIEQLSHMIEDSDRICIVTHMKPDGDAIGSSVAMYGFLKTFAKAEVRIVIPHRHPWYLEFLFDPDTSSDLLIHEEKPTEAERAVKESNLIICLDFNALHRTDRLENCLRESKGRKVLIDHHLNPDSASFDLVFSETEVSSASEYLYHILMGTSQIKGNARNLPMAAARALMTGMTTDTNNFSNSVHPSTLKMASELLDAGVDRDLIISELYNQYKESRMRLMGHILKDLMTITKDGVAYIVLDKKTMMRYHVEEGDTEGFVNLPLSISKVRMSLLLKEDDDKIRVSIRSRKGVSANMCSRLHFNGGGHENAAGGRLLIPQDIAGIEYAAEYVETHTHKFMTEENEK